MLQLNTDRSPSFWNLRFLQGQTLYSMPASTNNYNSLKRLTSLLYSEVCSAWWRRSKTKQTNENKGTTVQSVFGLLSLLLLWLRMFFIHLGLHAVYPFQLASSRNVQCPFKNHCLIFPPHSVSGGHMHGHLSFALALLRSPRFACEFLGKRDIGGIGLDQKAKTRAPY